MQICKFSLFGIASYISNFQTIIVFISFMQNEEDIKAIKLCLAALLIARSYTGILIDRALDNNLCLKVKIKAPIEKIDYFRELLFPICNIVLLIAYILFNLSIIYIIIICILLTLVSIFESKNKYCSRFIIVYLMDCIPAYKVEANGEEIMLITKKEIPYTLLETGCTLRISHIAGHYYLYQGFCR